MEGEAAVLTDEPNGVSGEKPEKVSGLASRSGQFINYIDVNRCGRKRESAKSEIQSTMICTIFSLPDQCEHQQP